MSLPSLKWKHILTEFAKLHMGLVVLVKKMSVLINFLLQNTNLVSVLSKNLPKFCWSCLTGLTHFAISVLINKINQKSQLSMIWINYWWFMFFYKNINNFKLRIYKGKVWIGMVNNSTNINQNLKTKETEKKEKKILQISTSRVKNGPAEKKERKRKMYLFNKDGKRKMYLQEKWKENCPCSICFIGIFKFKHLIRQTITNNDILKTIF